MIFKSKISLVKTLYYVQIESYAKSYILENFQSKDGLLDRKIIIKIMKYLLYFSGRSSDYQNWERIVKSNAGRTNFQTWINIHTQSGNEKQKFWLPSKIMNCCPALDNTVLFGIVSKEWYRCVNYLESGTTGERYFYISRYQEWKWCFFSVVYALLFSYMNELLL
jgi:hypothetical protein